MKIQEGNQIQSVLFIVLGLEETKQGSDNSKLHPRGQIWLAAWFCKTRKLRFVVKL